MKRKVLIITAAVLLLFSGCGKNDALIGEDKAKEIALSHAGITDSEVSRMNIRKDTEDRRAVYDVEIVSGMQVEYDYEIDAKSGEIISYDEEKKKSLLPLEKETDNSLQSTEITEQRAKEIALSKVEGATEENIRGFKKEFDDGIEKYEGEIYYNRIEYDFEIDAKSGKILQWETD